jgi:hypothetical protein
MDIKEHFYSDDPRVGHPDVRTNPPECVYYFLGNGEIEAAIQVNRAGNGTPLGILFMHPEKFGKKREALNFHPEHGVANTQIQVTVNGREYPPDPATLQVRWTSKEMVPLVAAEWQAEKICVREDFFCPTRHWPLLRRVITLQNQGQVECEVLLRTAIWQGETEAVSRQEMKLAAGSAATIVFDYSLFTRDFDHCLVELTLSHDSLISVETQKHWQRAAQFDCGDPALNHLFAASSAQLPAMIASSGAMDGSIWQYNLEWVRDQSMVVVALLSAGHHELAYGMLDRILRQFVTDQGDTVDSGRLRDPAEVELDQNGALLYAVWSCWAWCGDVGFGLIRKHWKKIVAVAEFPLQKIFWDQESRLLKNTREYWERHAVYGIREGYELAYQFFVAMGLEKAVLMAEKIGEPTLAARWQNAAAIIKQAMLMHSRFAMIDEGHFIKRRLASGEVQRTADVPDRSILPDGTPLKTEPICYLDPDTSDALPIAFEFIDPHSELAKQTLAHLETLWNQNWNAGGYSRYHVTSEPDSPGPWPFATMFVARAYHEAGDYEKVSRALQWLAQIQGGAAGSWFEFYGPRPVPPCPQVGVIPWTWAELIIFFIHHLLGVRPNIDRLLIRPRLLPELKTVKANLRWGGYRLDLEIHRAKKPAERGALINGQQKLFQDGKLILPLPESDLKITMTI